MRRIIALALGLLLLAGCGSMTVQDFAANKPELRLEEYFAGRSRAWGIFEDRFGRLRRQFIVDIQGTWDAGSQTLTLTEDFTYSDGETEQRVWTIRKQPDGSYRGTAEGVVGEASGSAAGNAFYWSYLFDLKVGSTTWRVRFDDWLWQQDGEVLVNRADISKWGVRIGGVAIFFRKLTH